MLKFYKITRGRILLAALIVLAFVSAAAFYRQITSTALPLLLAAYTIALLVPVFVDPFGKPADQAFSESPALQAGDIHYRQLIQYLPLGLLGVDATGKILNVNPRLLEIIGSPSEEATKEINVLTFAPLVEAGISGSIRRCMETGEPEQVECRYTSKWGRNVWLRLCLSAIRNSEDSVTDVLALVEDITNTRRAEEEVVEKTRRLDKELQLANTIQASLFPVHLPQIPGATLAATAVPANEVGGDYCDLFFVKDNCLGISIGDVMGKGVPAALFVAMTFAFVRNYAPETENPGQLVSRVNRSLFPQLELTEEFITFFYGIYNPDTRMLRYTNAGHNPPIVYRAASGECELLPVRDFFLGGKEEANFHEGMCQLNSGDIVLFYTDGLKEGRNAKKEQFGLERIMSILQENYVYDPASIQEIISFEFNDFLAGEPPSDDVTMMVIKIS